MIKRKRILVIIPLITLMVISLALAKRGAVETPPITNDPYITLLLHQTGKTKKMKLEEYLIGSVAAEMPASFELGALKAQAVCARTYAVRRILDKTKYPFGADLADDINTCQGYVSPEEFREIHYPHADRYLKKITQAVNETYGEIMVYNSKPIDALYHSTCGGQTESASDVWYQEVPYLVSVKCPYCKNSRHFSSVKEFSIADVNSIVGCAYNRQIDIEILQKTTSGRIKELLLNGNIISGEKFRKLLLLPSTCWQWRIIGNKLIINSRGYGHGVGLCQYGANGMAKAGKGYKAILRHYYRNIEFHKMEY